MQGRPVKSGQVEPMDAASWPAWTENIAGVPTARPDAIEKRPGVLCYMASESEDGDTEFYLVRVIRWGNQRCLVRVLLTSEPRCHVPIRSLYPIVAT